MNEQDTDRRVALTEKERNHISRLRAQSEAVRNAMIGVLNYMIEEHNLKGEWGLSFDGDYFEKVEKPAEKSDG
jgi:hypothetical protein